MAANDNEVDQLKQNILDLLENTDFDSLDELIQKFQKLELDIPFFFKKCERKRSLQNLLKRKCPTSRHSYKDTITNFTTIKTTRTSDEGAAVAERASTTPEESRMNRRRRETEDEYSPSIESEEDSSTAKGWKKYLIKNEWKEDWTKVNGQIERLALGRKGSIGQLYDVTTDTVLDEFFFLSLPSDFIETKNQGKSHTKIYQYGQLSDRFYFLNVDPDQQLSILIDPSELTGIGEYLIIDNKISYQISSVTASEMYSTVNEILKANESDLKNHRNEKIDPNSTNSYVIVGINYGNMVVASLEYHNANENNSKEVNDLLSKEKFNCLNALLESRSHSCSVCADHDFYKDIRIKIHAHESVNLAGFGKSVSGEGAIEFIRQLPGILKEEFQGKGIPLTFIMIPLSAFSDKKSNMTEFQSIERNISNQIVALFEKFTKLDIKLNNFEKNVYPEYKSIFPDDYLEKLEDTFVSSIRELNDGMRAILKENIRKIKFNKMSIEELTEVIDDFKTGHSKLAKNAANGFNGFIDKVNIMEKCSDNKVAYICKTQRFDVAMLRNIEYDCYVLYTSPDPDNSDPDIEQKTMDLFFTMAQKPEENDRYIFVDVEVNCDLTYKNCEAKIFHYKRGEIISRDVYAENEAKRCLNVATSSNTLLASCTPEKAVVLKMQCPGCELGRCSEEVLIWSCGKCKKPWLYGSDEHCFCDCGKSKWSHMLFKCHSSSHGDKFLPREEKIFLDRMLELQETPEVLNLLILGQLGVGKSLWINIIINYLQYKKLEIAEKEELFFVIPTNVHLMESYETIYLGNKDSEWFVNKDKTSTYDVRSFNVMLNKKMIRIIDTPELGFDPIIEEDGKNNIIKIWESMISLNHIHGICILMKHEAKIDVAFNEAITEFLSRLNAKARKNIFFCFVNNSVNDFTIKSNISLSDCGFNDRFYQDRKIHFFNNSAFLNLCKFNIDTDKKEILSQIWEQSAIGTENLFQQIMKSKALSIETTKVFHEKRNSILSSWAPLAEISRVIQMNLAVIEDQQKQLREHKNPKKLLKSLRKPNITLMPCAFSNFNLVCTNCVKFSKSLYKLSMIDQPHICCDQCDLRDVIPLIRSDESLKNCFIFKLNQEFCSVCKCSQKLHKHIRYSPEINIKAKKEEKRDTDGKGKKELLEDYKKELQALEKEYKEEQNTISKTCCASREFLKEQELINLHRDCFQEYLKDLIEQQEKIPKKSHLDEIVLKKMKDVLASYKFACDKAGESIMKSVHLIDRLSRLTHTGKQIAANLKLSNAIHSNNTMRRLSLTKIQRNRREHNDGIFRRQVSRYSQGFNFGPFK